MYIFHIPSWVPSEEEPFNGNFITRHIEAISSYIPCITLQLFKSRDCRETLINREKENNIIVSAYIGSSIWDHIGIIRKWRIYRKGQQAIAGIIREFGLPELIHLHVVFPYGLIASDAAQKYKIPLVLTEHWSGYRPKYWKQLSCIQRRLIRNTYRKVDAYSAVSNELQHHISRLFPSTPGYIIPNTVDSEIFKTAEVISKDKKTILHISTLDDATKNISGLLRVMGKLSKLRNDFILKIIHEKRNLSAEEYVVQQELSSCIEFMGSKTTYEVVHELQQCDFLVSFSHYETFGCVVIEAFACGKPVVVTDAGALPELVNDKRGLMVPVGDEQALLDALMIMLDHHQEYDSKALREYVHRKFSPNSVGKLFIEFYKRIVPIL